MGKDPHINAEKTLSKAKNLFSMEQYKKAANYYYDAGNIYLKLQDFKEAKECFFDGAKAFLKTEKLPQTIEMLRFAGNASLLMDDFLDTYQIFKTALKCVPQLISGSDRDTNYVLFSSLSYLCLFIVGKQDEGIKLIKETKTKVDLAYFKGNPLIKLIKNLTVAIRDKNKEYLDKVEENFERYKFRDAEERLMKEVLVVAKTHISIKTDLDLDKGQYTTRDTIRLGLKIDTNPLVDVSKYPFYNYTIKELKILNIGVTLSDNLSAQKKPKLPISLVPGKQYEYEFGIKPHFQVDNPFIGPILLTCLIDDKFTFFLKTQSLKPKIVSPTPSLDISYRTLKTPLIDQTFPMEFLIANNSAGSAFNIDIELEFPPQLKVIRGTTKKQIYSLSSKDKMNWEISLKPTEVGDFVIKTHAKFKDPDQNEIEDNKNFEFSIKL